MSPPDQPDELVDILFPDVYGLREDEIESVIFDDEGHIRHHCPAPETKQIDFSIIHRKDTRNDESESKRS